MARGSNHPVKRRKSKQPFSLRSLGVKQWLIAGFVLLAACALICCLALGVFSPDDGSLKVKNGAVVNAHERSLIINLGEGGKAAYYEIARVNGALDGFEEKPDIIVRQDANEKTFWFESADENAKIFQYYFSGTARGARETMLNSAAMRGILSTDDAGIERVEGEISGALANDQEYTGYIVTVQDDSDSIEWRKFVYAYVDAGRGAGVVLCASSRASERDKLASDDELLAFMHKAFMTTEIIK